MNHALRVAEVLALIVFVPAVAFAQVAPELDPGMSGAGLALLGGTALFVIERYRRRTK